MPHLDTPFDDNLRTGVIPQAQPRVESSLFPILNPPVWSRLSVLDLGSTVFVMDRGNGRWIVIPALELPILKLLTVEPGLLPEALREKCRTLSGELQAAGIGRPVKPVPDHLNTLILKLTNACNYACTYCYDFEPEEHATRIDFRTACRAIEQSLEITPSSLNIIFHGGEPTLVFPLLRDIVTYGEAAAGRLHKSIAFSGQTNLSRLTSELVEFSIAHSIVWGVSLDGPPELNDQFRILHTGQGTYQYFARALRDFPDFVRRCGILTTVTSATDHHLLTVARHFRDLGFQAWDWSLFQPIGRGRCKADSIDFSLPNVIASWNQLFEAVESAEFEGFNVKAVTKYLDNFFEGPGGNMCMRKDCGAGRDLLSLSSDGVIEACDCIDPQGPLSSLGKLTPSSEGVLRMARDSDKARFIRSRNVEAGKCSSCIWLAVCGGTCLAHSTSSINDIWEAECAIAVNAFSQIAQSVAQSDRLREYRESYQKQTCAADDFATTP